MPQRSSAPASPSARPSRAEAEEAVRTLLRWAGDDPAREGLADTPKRVAEAYEEWFGGYAVDPKALLERTFGEVSGYDDMVMLRAIPFNSHCEHHLAAITGRVHIGYLPDRRVVGISKLARLVDVFARRLQIQERLTAQIADTIHEVLRPHGVGVVVQATHGCMTSRGIRSHGASMTTTRLLGRFRDDPATRNEFLSAIAMERG